MWNNYLKSLGIFLRAYNGKILAHENLWNLSKNSENLCHVSHNQLSSPPSAQYNGSSIPGGRGQENGAPSPQDRSLGLQFHPRMRKLSANCIPSLAPFHRSSDPGRHAHWGPIPPLSPHLQGQAYRAVITLPQVTFRGEAQFQEEREDKSSCSWSKAVSQGDTV